MHRRILLSMKSESTNIIVEGMDTGMHKRSAIIRYIGATHDHTHFTLESFHLLSPLSLKLLKIIRLAKLFVNTFLMRKLGIKTCTIFTFHRKSSYTKTFTLL